MRSSAILLLALAWPLACTAFCPPHLALPLASSSPTRACRQSASPMMMSQVVPNNNRGRMRKAKRGRLPSLADVIENTSRDFADFVIASYSGSTKMPERQLITPPWSKERLRAFQQGIRLLLLHFATAIENMAVENRQSRRRKLTPGERKLGSSVARSLSMGRGRRPPQ